MDRVKKCMGLVILLLMTGCSVGVSTEQEPNPQEERKLKDELRIEAESQIVNLHQGNNITYADGYYYYRSQTENYSLCRTKGTGMSVEVVADQVPGSIYVREDKVYFINVSDSRTLYCVGTDGSGCELLVPKLCMKFVTDGEWLYYLVYEDEYVLYKSSLDGKWEQLVRLNEQGEEEILASDVWRFTIARGQAYVINEEEIHRVDLTTGEERLLAERKKASGNDGQEREDAHPWYSGSYYNRGIFLVNGQIFAKYYESEDKGVLWHILDGETFVVFEDMEPLTAEELVLDTSLLYEINCYYPGRIDENAGQYLDADGELHYEESFGTREAGSVYGYFSITLPKFNSELDSYEQMNQQMEGLLELAIEDKNSFFQEMSELDQDQWISWYTSSEALDLVLEAAIEDTASAVMETLPYADWQKEGHELLLGVTLPDYYYVLPETRREADGESEGWEGDYLYYNGVIWEDGGYCHIISLIQEEKEREFLLVDATGEIKEE